MTIKKPSAESYKNKTEQAMCEFDEKLGEVTIHLPPEIGQDGFVTEITLDLEMEILEKGMPESFTISARIEKEKTPGFPFIIEVEARYGPDSRLAGLVLDSDPCGSTLPLVLPPPTHPPKAREPKEPRLTWERFTEAVPEGSKQSGGWKLNIGPEPPIGIKYPHTVGTVKYDRIKSPEGGSLTSQWHYGGIQVAFECRVREPSPGLLEFITRILGPNGEVEISVVVPDTISHEDMRDLLQNLTNLDYPKEQEYKPQPSIDPEKVRGVFPIEASITFQ